MARRAEATPNAMVGNKGGKKNKRGAAKEKTGPPLPCARNETIMVDRALATRLGVHIYEQDKVCACSCLPNFVPVSPTHTQPTASTHTRARIRSRTHVFSRVHALTRSRALHAQYN